MGFIRRRCGRCGGFDPLPPWGHLAAGGIGCRATVWGSVGLCRGIRHLCNGGFDLQGFCRAQGGKDVCGLHLGHLDPASEQGQIYAKQCSAPGAMISVYLKGGEAESFRFLNNLKLLHMAVSLGGNESLAEHPASMTHIEVDLEDRIEGDITDALVRLSIGIEDPDDLIADIEQALIHV